MIACLTSSDISKQEAIMATVEGGANSEFSTALTICLLKTSFTNLLRMSRQNVSEGLLAEDGLAVLPRRFGKNVITTLCGRQLNIC